MDTVLIFEESTRIGEEKAEHKDDMAKAWGNPKVSAVHLVTMAEHQAHVARSGEDAHMAAAGPDVLAAMEAADRDDLEFCVHDSMN